MLLSILSAYNNEIAPVFSPEDVELYGHLYSLIKPVAERLQIELPQLSICNSDSPIVCSDYYCCSARTFHKEDDPRMPFSYIVISAAIINQSDKLYGTLCHELFHVYQKKNNPELFKNGSKEGIDCISDPAEIGADAYGIFRLADISGKSVEECGEILCSEEKRISIAYYEERLKYARQMYEISRKQPEEYVEEKNYEGKRKFLFFRNRKC